jgi:uncharacterized damage-inducible protein DinB
MGRAAVDQLMYLMDEAFDAPGHEHSLLANLASLHDDDWDWQPPGGKRTISAIVGHVAACKHMYDHYAFGEAQWTWADPRWSKPRSPSELVDWLKEGHHILRGHVAGLSDDDLVTLRRANWGEMKETRWLVSAMIEHDLYHAGEINHIRALKQGNDAWPWEPV